MKLADLYAQPGLTLSVEFFPPKTDKGEEALFGEIELNQIAETRFLFCYIRGWRKHARKKLISWIEFIANAVSKPCAI